MGKSVIRVYNQKECCSILKREYIPLSGTIYRDMIMDMKGGAVNLGKDVWNAAL
jgi:hypothetical protein